MLSPQYQQISTPPQEYQYQPRHQYPFPSPQENTPTATSEPGPEPGPVPGPEPETVSRIWKVVAALSSNILLVGYLILPVAFEGPSETPPVNKAGTTTAALVLIAPAYVLSLGVGLIQRHNGSFVIQHICLPGLYSSLLSLFNVVFNIIARNLFPLNALEKAGMGLPSAFGVVYVVAALWVYANVAAAGSGTGTRSGTDTGTGTGTGIGIGTGLGFGFGLNNKPSQGETVELLTEEEMQRRQLNSLLEQRKKTGLKGSPRTTQKTFQVAGPEYLSGRSDWGRYKR